MWRSQAADRSHGCRGETGTAGGSRQPTNCCRASHTAPTRQTRPGLRQRREVEACRAETPGAIERRIGPGRIVPVRDACGIASRRQIQAEARLSEMFGEEEPPRSVVGAGERAYVIHAQRLEADQQHVRVEPGHEVRLDLGGRVERPARAVQFGLCGRHQHPRIALDKIALHDQHQRRRRCAPLLAQLLEGRLRRRVERLLQVVRVARRTGVSAGPELAAVGAALIGRVFSPEKLSRQFVVHAHEEGTDERSIRFHERRRARQGDRRCRATASHARWRPATGRSAPTGRAPP